MHDFMLDMTVLPAMTEWVMNSIGGPDTIPFHGYRSIMLC
jgi:hypothetical protein